MREFRENQFDVVYSNSVIEHVGDIEDMLKMAREVRRVGRWYFLQTSNLFFPMEPHFLFPLFQFLPISCRVYLVRHFNLGWVGRVPDSEGAERKVRSIHLLSKADLRFLFPDANITTEKLFWIDKVTAGQQYWVRAVHCIVRRHRPIFERASRRAIATRGGCRSPACMDFALTTRQSWHRLKAPPPVLARRPGFCARRASFAARSRHAEGADRQPAWISRSRIRQSWHRLKAPPPVLARWPGFCARRRSAETIR